MNAAVCVAAGKIVVVVAVVAVVLVVVVVLDAERLAAGIVAVGEAAAGKQGC